MNKAIPVDVLTDGKMGSSEMETERSDNSHRSAFMAKQADEKDGDVRDKICVHICILYTQGLMIVVTAQIVAFTPWLLSLCTLKRRGGSLHVFPGKQSDNAVFVPGVA